MSQQHRGFVKRNNHLRSNIGEQMAGTPKALMEYNILMNCPLKCFNGLRGIISLQIKLCRENLLLNWTWKGRSSELQEINSDRKAQPAENCCYSELEYTASAALQQTRKKHTLARKISFLSSKILSKRQAEEAIKKFLRILKKTVCTKYFSFDSLKTW